MVALLLPYRSPARRVFIGIHFAWDFSQDATFGIAGGAKGLVRAELTGPAFLTGGISGIEGSVLTLLACLVVGAYLLS